MKRSSARSAGSPRCRRRKPSCITPFAVAAYIVAAYWFTASTSFANPAVTIARAFSDTYAGIRPADVAGFIAAQGVGATLGAVLFSWLVPLPPRVARERRRAASDPVRRVPGTSMW